MSARAWVTLAAAFAGLAYALPLLVMLSVSLHPQGQGLGGTPIYLVRERAELEN